MPAPCKYPTGGYSVKGVRYFEGHEGEGYNAILLRDGKVVAKVIEDASGGPVDIQFADDEEAKFKAHLATLPEEEFHGSMLKVSDGMFIEELLHLFDMQKAAARYARKGQTVFRAKEDKPGVMRIFPRPPSPETTASILAKYGDKIEFVVD
jgi:hypothetical protein